MNLWWFQFTLYLVITSFYPKLTDARIHHLVLEDDAREQITISTYGFLKNGLLQINVKKLSFTNQLERPQNSFAFILEKTQNGGFSSFTTNEKSRDFCTFLSKHQEYVSKNYTKEDDLQSYLLNEPDFKKHKYSLLIFRLNLGKKVLDVLPINNMGNLKIDTDLTDLNSKSIFKNVTHEKGENKKNQLNKIKIFSLDNRTYSFQFQVNIKRPDDEGLYIFNFFNCFQPQASKKLGMDNYFSASNLDELRTGINLDLELVEKNDGSYLSAGEIPVATLYLTWSIIYFLGGVSWFYIIRSSKEVFKIHYLMMGLVFIKSISLTFHAINMHYIALNGRHEAIWAILFYITYVLRGLLLIISILLVGTGWTFIKSILSENERRLFAIVIPLQILAITSYIFLEEKEEGDISFVTWRQLFFLLDLLCCGAILFPIVWSIKHLEQASATDGKMVINLKKLKIFKHFYMMVICYVYFTRIIGFLLKQVLPFRYEWFNELSSELVTFTFFAMTAYKFQPAVNNPYLQLSQIDEEEMNMKDLNRNEFSPNDNYLSGDTETVLDLIEHNYSSSHLIDVPIGANSNNPNLFSRKQQNSPV